MSEQTATAIEVGVREDNLQGGFQPLLLRRVGAINEIRIAIRDDENARVGISVHVIGDVFRKMTRQGTQPGKEEDGRRRRMLCWGKNRGV